MGSQRIRFLRKKIKRPQPCNEDESSDAQGEGTYDFSVEGD
jgi:hypothetical protein